MFPTIPVDIRSPKGLIYGKWAFLPKTSFEGSSDGQYSTRELDHFDGVANPKSIDGVANPSRIERAANAIRQNR